jgi:hypothetical protein
MCSKNLQGQTARWIQRLQEYNFTSEHSQGRKHNNADDLSRQRCQEKCTHCHKAEARPDIKKVQAIADKSAADWDPAALRTEHLHEMDIRPTVEEAETGQRPGWKDIADRSPMFTNYWAQ